MNQLDFKTGFRWCSKGMMKIRLDGYWLIDRIFVRTKEKVIGKHPPDNFKHTGFE